MMIITKWNCHGIVASTSSERRRRERNDDAPKSLMRALVYNVDAGGLEASTGDNCSARLKETSFIKGARV